MKMRRASCHQTATILALLVSGVVLAAANHWQGHGNFHQSQCRTSIMHTKLAETEQMSKKTSTQKTPWLLLENAFVFQPSMIIYISKLQVKSKIFKTLTWLLYFSCLGKLLLTVLKNTCFAFTTWNRRNTKQKMEKHWLGFKAATLPERQPRGHLHRFWVHPVTVGISHILRSELNKLMQSLH